jgi:ADP-dependent NAD(P)H-hydrate dehydratase
MKPDELTAGLLRRMPLPWPEAGSKDERGSVLVIAGSAEVPGAALLAATAALRAGAGKLQVATVNSAALPLAVAVPEAMVIGLAETHDGGIDHHAATGRTTASAKKVDAVLIGPGMTEGEPTTALTAALCSDKASASFILDAAALCGLRPHADAVRSLRKRAVITPHAGEMAQFLNRSRDEIEADPLRAARSASDLLDAVVVMKGAQSYIVAPDGKAWLFKGGGVGLATSGSGDVLAGLIVGLLARGADPHQAALWGVYLHGEAGRILGEKVGPLGYLARDLATEVPTMMRDLSAPR